MLIVDPASSLVKNFNQMLSSSFKRSLEALQKLLMICPCPPPIFKMNTSNLLYETESSFEIMLSEFENEWKVTDILLAIDILSETQYRTEKSFY